MKRIDVADVPAMYRRVGMRPLRYQIDGDGCGCLLSAMAADAGLPPHRWTDEVVRHLSARGFDRKYLHGLWAGFDGVSANLGFGNCAGYSDGRAAWRALVDAGMVSA